MKNLYVSNISYAVDNQQLNDLFAAYGAVNSARIIMDRETGRSKGFGFVEMESDSEANAAISALNGKDIEGRALNVSEARPREESGSFGGGRGRPGPGRRF